MFAVEIKKCLEFRSQRKKNVYASEGFNNNRSLKMFALNQGESLFYGWNIIRCELLKSKWIKSGAARHGQIFYFFIHHNFFAYIKAIQ